MKRIDKTVSCSLIALIIISAISISAVQAQPPDQAGFQADFESGQLAEGWESSPEVTFNNGALRLYGGNFVMKLGVWGDQNTQIRLRFNESMGEFLIHYFANEQGSYNLIFLADMIILEKGRGPENTTLLGETPNTLSSNTWIDVGIAVQGGEHVITFDGETLITATDPEPMNPGAFGFRKFGAGSVDIDSVSLTATNTAPQDAEDQATTAQPAAATPAATPTEEIQAGLFETIQDLFDTQGTQVDLWTFVINLLLSVLLAFILGRVYIYWGGSLSNRRKFAANFMLMTVTTTFIILVVRSSVALSLGLVGALSIVRFRTAVKEPEELAYLFFAIGIGIGLGDNQRVITIVAFAIAIVIIGLLKLFRKREADVNLHLTITSHNPQKLSLEQIMAALQPHTAKLKLLRMDENNNAIETAFLVEFKHVEDLNQARAAIQALSPEAAITFLDNKGIW